MQQSATVGRRARRKQQTASELTAVSRRLTAQHGLAGFTIEEVCAEVDVSRRTFFNYFATKDDAVIGASPDDETQKFVDDFLALGRSDWSRVITDLVDLVALHLEAAGIDAVGHSDLMRALEREPKLLARYIGTSREREHHAVALVAKRQGVEAGDLRAEAAVSILSSLLKLAGEQVFDRADPRDFSEILADQLAMFRSLLGVAAGTS